MSKRVGIRSFLLILVFVFALTSVGFAGVTGVVKTPSTDGAAHIRKGPGMSYRVVGYGQYGDKLDILSRSNPNWYRVKHQRTRVSGYMASMYISILDKPTKAYGAVGRIKTKNSGANVYLRSGAGTRYSAKGYLKDGQKLSIIGTKGNWKEVQAIPSGKTGYVHSSYVKNGFPGKTTANVHLRAKGSSSASIIKTLKSDKSITILNVGSSWTKVKADGKTGYIYNKYYRY